MEEHKVQLYGIVGMFTELTTQFSFGGYFEFDPKDEAIAGEMVDFPMGNSTFAGKMHLRDLKFTKQYEDKRFEVHYEFTRNLESDIWIGRYKIMGAGRIGDGEARCQTTFMHARDRMMAAQRGLEFPFFLE